MEGCIGGKLKEGLREDRRCVGEGKGWGSSCSGGKVGKVGRRIAGMRTVGLVGIVGLKGVGTVDTVGFDCSSSGYSFVAAGSTSVSKSSQFHEHLFTKECIHG